MRTMIVIGTSLLLLACAASPASNSAAAPTQPAGDKAAPAGAEGPASGSELPIPVDLVAQISRSSEIGRQLYALDRVAAAGTDVLFSNVPDALSSGIGGYLALPEASAAGGSGPTFLVSFFTQDAPPRVAYEVRFQREREPAFEAFAPPKAASPTFITLVRARQLALSALTSAPQPINPLVLPASLNGEDGILVYLLAGTKQHDIAVLGKHYRFLVPPDASTVSYMMPLSNDIMEIPTKAPSGATPEALAVTQVVTDFPLETHVFVSLQIQLPIYVGTRRGMWRVEGDTISFLGEQIPGSPPAAP
jgi:hypothetical protein